MQAKSAHEPQLLKDLLESIEKENLIGKIDHVDERPGDGLYAEDDDFSLIPNMIMPLSENNLMLAYANDDFLEDQPEEQKQFEKDFNKQLTNIAEDDEELNETINK